ncbi:hypothetical protein LOD99_5744 [Oopsacas minuta]|uniref:VLIG-type G domain-containing protein n=1 Tax=Oopsacas minuta TaxID=111878 RepID=A0AAV7JQZ7_9METZ|nr:hypothetical protein LOD99_5744 [Oopsacas minuta]
MEDFCKHLEILRPPVISLRDAITISSTLPQQEITSLQDLPKFMLDKIMMLDCTSRQFPRNVNPHTPSQGIVKILDMVKFHSQDNTCDLVHPMDIFLYLFFQCTPIFRQTFVTQVSKCQLSLPLIASHLSPQRPTFYHFALKTLYKDYIDQDHAGKSFSVTEENLPIISFIRVGECGKSQKSEMLNQIIGIPDYFFHRNQLGNVKRRFFLDGTVEIAWLLPKFDNEPHFSKFIFPEPCMMLNLRGNALDYRKQLDFISSVSTLIYILVPISQCNQHLSEFLISFHNEYARKSVFLLYQSEISQLTFEPTLPDILETPSDNVILLNKTSLGEDINEIAISISSMLMKVPIIKINLEDCTEIAKTKSIYIDTDEDNIQDCQSVVDKIIQTILSNLATDSEESEPLALAKQSMLPLQGDSWLLWAEANRDSHKVGISKSQETIKQEMNKARQNQFIYLQNPSPIFVDVIQHCKTFGSPKGEFYTIWNLLSNDFNSLSREHLPSLYAEYSKWQNLSYNTKFESELSIEERNEIKKQSKQNLVRAAKNIAESSFGIEHIFRELGQAFEAHKVFSRKSIFNLNRALNFNLENLNNIVAHLLIEGQAFEIIDGDANHVALSWVTSVLDSLALIIGYDSKIFVCSILGTQSTGKSTLLNTMFGAKFPVSSGRCTRGIFMQLIPIESMLRTKLGYDYLVLLDTEGLRAPELSIDSSYRRDNELATIAIGLGDMTIINLYGEGHGEVQDILQIIIFAFIRMKESYIKPRCMFVHQNVPDTHAHTNLLTARSNLIKTLDKMTECAAQQENKNLFYKQFTDVIEFNLNEEVFYFPGLFEGEPPLNKVSIGYSKKAANLRQYILTCFVNTPNKKFQTVMNWSIKLEALWKSVLEENFIFSYKNALEVTSRFELDRRISSWHSSYIQLFNKSKSESINQLFNADFDELDEIRANLVSNLQQEKLTPSIGITTQEDLLQNYFVVHDNVEVYSQWKGNTENYFQCKREKHTNKMEEDLNSIYKLQKNKKKMDENFVRSRKEILLKVHQLFTETIEKGESLSDKSLVESRFNSIWDEWKSEIQVEKVELCDISRDLQKAYIDSPLIKAMNVLADKQMILSNCDEFVNIGNGKFQHLSSLQPQNTSNSYYYLHDMVSKVRLGIGYIRSIFSKESKEDVGNAQFKIILSILSSECERKIDDYLSTLLKNQSPYDPNYFLIIIDICHQILSKHNSTQQQVSQQPLELTTDFIYDMIFFNCCKAIPMLQKIQDEFLSRTSLDLKFEYLEEILRRTFSKLCEGIESEYLCALELAKIVFSGLKNGLADSVSREFLSAFMNDSKNIITYSDRPSLILTILKDLARDKNFNNYLSYIYHPINYLSQNIQNTLTTYSKRNDIMEKVVNNISKNVEILIDFFISECSHACPDDESSPNADMLIRFKESFYTQIKCKVRDVTYNDLDVLDLYTISNYQQFSGLFAKELRRMANDTDWLIWITDTLKLETFLYKRITDSILECEELCPFCNELCQLSCGDHKHYCGTFHRPQGVSGWRDRYTNQICYNECTTNLRDRGRFYYNDLLYEFIHYRRVNSRFRSWKILGEDAIDSKYWHWVLCQFEKDFVEHFKIQSNPYIQENWSNLTEDESMSLVYSRLPESENRDELIGHSITLPTNKPLTPSNKQKHNTSNDDPTPPIQPPIKLICEKIVTIYDDWFRGEDPVLGKTSFWDEFFLLKANPTHLENLINHTPWERLIEIKYVLQMLFQHSVEALHSSKLESTQHHIRAFNALQTLCILIRDSFKKKIAESTSDPLSLLFTPDNEDAMKNLIKNMSRILTDEYPISLKNLCLKLMLLMLTAEQDVNDNAMLPFFMSTSVFEPLKQILARADLTDKHGYDSVLILTLLLSYKKNASSHPYVIKFSLLDDILTLNGLGCVISSALKEHISLEEKMFEKRQQSSGVMSRLGNYIGSFVPGQQRDDIIQVQGPSFSSKTNDAVLLAMYEAVHLNRNFISILTSTNDALMHTHTLFGMQGPAVEAVFHNLMQSVSRSESNSVPTTPITDNTATQAPVNLMGTFLTYSSLVFLQINNVYDWSERARLCLTILICLAEDHYAGTILHDRNLPFPVKLYKQPHMVSPIPFPANENLQNLPLAGHILDLMSEFIRGQLRKSLNLDLCLKCLGVIHRLICFQNRNCIRMFYQWSNLWFSLFTMMRFLLSHENYLISRMDIMLIMDRILVIFNMFITYGDTFLSSPKIYDELFYEIIRENNAFEKIDEVLKKRPVEYVENVPKLKDSLQNLLAIVRYFVPKIDKYSLDNQKSSLTSDDVMSLIQANYESLTLKLQENLHSFDRFDEKNEKTFFNHLVCSITTDFRSRISVKTISQKDLIGELTLF